MQREMNSLFKETQDELSRESEMSKEIIREAAGRLTDLKKGGVKKLSMKETVMIDPREGQSRK